MLVKLAHLFAFLLQVQILAFTFHCAERLKTRDTCTRMLHSCSRCRSKRSPFHCTWKIENSWYLHTLCILAQGADPSVHLSLRWKIEKLVKTCTRLCILAPSADPSVHLSLRWKIEKSCNLHTYMHSCSRCRSKRSPFTALKDWKLVILDTCTRIGILAPSLCRCRSKRSPFTALKDWKLVKLAHVYAFLLQVQIQAFTFHCAERLKTRETCTRICILAPGADPSVHLSLRWKIENSWYLHTYLHSCSRCRSKRSPLHCAERLKNSWNLHTYMLLAQSADPSVHLSLRWKIENSWDLHTYIHSCSRCRSKRSPFTALKDWKLLKLAHVYAFLLQVQIQAFTFHCAERLKTLKKSACTRICILAPGADPSVHLPLRWKIENSWYLHTYMHSCSKCRSKRSPFTALKDWKLVILAHVYAFLLQMQIQAFTFHWAERLKTCDTCNT